MADKNDLSMEHDNVRYLSPPDAETLDALLATGQHDGSFAGSMPGEAADRARQLSDLLHVLEAMPAEDGSDRMVENTLAAVRSARQRERFAAQVQMLSEPRPTLDVGWRQIATAAAVFIVAISLLLPVLERNRAEGRRVACLNNLRAAGTAIGQYANDHGQVLPRGHVQPGAIWWNVGAEPNGEDGIVPSNSAHLYLLVRNGYVTPSELACPENIDAVVRDHDPHLYDWPRPEAVSYSYQNQYTPEPISVDRSPRMAVLADKNPLFVSTGNGDMTFDRQTPRTASSRIHDNRGQNVLRLDGTVTWQASPMIRLPGRVQSDNIWVAENVELFTGRETPSRPDDSFLVP